MSPGFNVFLKIVGNAMAAFGVLIALINPPAVFNGEQSAAFVFLVGGLALALFAFVLRPESATSLLARLPNVGALAAAGVLAAWGVSKSPSVHRWIVLAEHEERGPRLHLSSFEDYYTAAYGPALVRSDKAMNFRYSLLHDYPEAHSLVSGRAEFAFVYASLLLRGRTHDAIFADPIGPSLFLGTLVSESFEPFWWPALGWLRKDLPLKPADSWVMGMLPPDWARARFQQLVAHPPDGDPRILEALLYIALHRPGFATHDQVSTILADWAKLRRDAGFPIDGSIQALREVAAQIPAGGGIRFEFPASWSPALREAFSSQIVLFLRASGLDPKITPGGVSIAVNAEPREWDNVAYTTRETSYKTIETFVPGRTLPNNVYLPGRTVRTQQTFYTDVEKRGRLGVPTLLVRFGDATSGKTILLPPPGIVSASTVRNLWSCNPAKSADSRVSIEEHFFADMTLAPWRFGMATPSELDNANFRGSAGLPR